MSKIIFEGSNYPVFQNVLFDTYEEAVNSPTGDILLVQDEKTGIICNVQFDQKKLVYTDRYQHVSENNCKPLLNPALSAGE